MSYQIHTEDREADVAPAAWHYTMKPEPAFNPEWFQYPEEKILE